MKDNLEGLSREALIEKINTLAESASKPASPPDLQNQIFSKLVKNAPIIVFALDSQGIFIHSDGKALEDLGLKPGEIIGRSVFDVYADNEQILADIREVLNGKVIRTINKVGNAFFDTMFTPTRNEKGTITGLVGIGFESTERNQAILERERFFNTTIALVCRANLDGYFLELNPAWEKTLGFTVDELKSKKFLEFVHADDVGSTLQQVNKLSKGKKAINFINRYRCKNGSYKWLSWFSVAYGENIYASALDITETKKIENKLRESEERFKSIFNSVQDCIMVWDKNYICLFANKAAENFFGNHSHGLKGQTLMNGIGRNLDFSKEWKKRIDTVFQSGDSITVKDKDLINDTLVYSQSTISPIYDANLKIFAVGVVYRDISELEESKIETERHAKDLERSNQDLEQFAYVSSHDLQEPLRKIKNYTDLLERKLKNQTDEDILAYMKTITSGAARMQALINDLLSYSRVTTKGKSFELLDLNIIIKETIDNLELSIYKSDAKISFESLPSIPGDAAQLRQLFQNLLSNALKFKGNKTPEIKIGLEKQTQNKVILSVSDNGIGLDMKYADKIFTIFQRLHSREIYEGTGIGLAICKRIVERHGGKIWLESEPGQGTTFYIELSKKIT